MTNDGKLDWEHLHVFLAVARSGSARQAAEQLGCHYTSVIRRIGNLETDLNAKLFDRSARGYALTDLGREIVDHADNMSSEADAISRRLFGADVRLSGTLRVAMTTTIASYLLVEDLRDFAESYPDVDLQIVTDTGFADLSKGEAHVTVRVSNNPGDYLVGRRYGTYCEAVYATPDYLARANPKAKGTQARWLHWLKGEPFAKYIAQSEFPEVTQMQTISDEVLLLNAAKSGMGLATLPCFYADPAPELVRAGAAAPVACLDIWLLAHPDVRHNTRVRTFMDQIGQALERKKGLLAGEI